MAVTSSSSEEKEFSKVHKILLDVGVVDGASFDTFIKALEKDGFGKLKEDETIQKLRDYVENESLISSKTHIQGALGPQR